MSQFQDKYDVIILGAGAAGLMCAITAGQCGLRVLVLEKANRIGKKILMSGGGRCNFTNLNTTPDNFISANPHFCKSALARYTPWDFVEMVNRHAIAWHEKGPGQLFCDHSSKDIVAMLAQECSQAGVEIRTRCDIAQVEKQGDFQLQTSLGNPSATNLVIATGGLSIPKMGASDFGHKLARQFGLDVLPLRAGLVPFTLSGAELEHWSSLSGVSIAVEAQCTAARFMENMLFTHRGLSGPALLQLSSYWQPGEPIYTDLMPGTDAAVWLEEKRTSHPKQSLRNALAQVLSKRVAELFCNRVLGTSVDATTALTDLNREAMQNIAKHLSQLRWKPSGTEGYRTAEVTLGGVNTDEISSKTLRAHKVPGLYLIGEVLDVTGQLGGYNFQWAWASGWCAGEALAGNAQAA